MHVSTIVDADFQQRKQKVLDLIKESGIDFYSVGIFGSYARGNFKATSDIDFCIITDSKPDRKTSGCLREEADLLKADIVYVTKRDFTTCPTNFLRQLKRDYIEVMRNEK